MWTVLLRFQQLRNGLPSLNVAVPALKMIHVKDVQKKGTTPEIIEQVHDMILDDLRMEVREMSETIGISEERVGYILQEELDKKKFCARTYRDKIGAACTNIMTTSVSEGLRNQSSIFGESFPFVPSQQLPEWCVRSCKKRPLLEAHHRLTSYLFQGRLDLHSP